MIDINFLSVKFTEVTLLHILILVGIPYILFYFFHRKTNFDNFPEKWELGLFVFVTGGIITFLSLFLINFGFPFWFSYILFILLLCFFLIILALSSQNKQEKSSGKWVLIKLKNGRRFKGLVTKSNPYFTQIKRSINKKIVEVNEKDEDIERDWDNIQFNTSEIFAIYSL